MKQVTTSKEAEAQFRRRMAGKEEPGDRFGSFGAECHDIRARHYRPRQDYGNDPGFVLLAWFVGLGIVFAIVNAILVVHFGIDVTGLFQNVLDQR